MKIEQFLVRRTKNKTIDVKKTLSMIRAALKDIVTKEEIQAAKKRANIPNPIRDNQIYRDAILAVFEQLPNETITIDFLEALVARHVHNEGLMNLSNAQAKFSRELRAHIAANKGVYLQIRRGGQGGITLLNTK